MSTPAAYPAKGWFSILEWEGMEIVRRNPMAKFNFSAVVGTSAKTASGPTVCVTQATLDQMAKHEGVVGLRQAVM